MNPIRKTLFTLNVDNYAPQITAITYPFLRRYAEKIGAEFHVITERRFPHMPVTYEKLQIYDLAREMGNDWNLFLDSDALVHPETIDFTPHLRKDTVLHNANDMAAVRWTYDEYFLRDGRHIGSCNWFAIASDWCVDLWTPLDIPLDRALANIRPIPAELRAGITREHLIDDYTLSRNIARFGLKFKKAIDIQDECGIPSANFFWHQYTIPNDEKVIGMRRVLREWGV